MTPLTANRMMKTRIEPLDRQINWRWLPELARWTVEQAVTLQQIPGPTFAEAARAAWMAEQFRALGLVDVSIDAVENVFGRLPGTDPTLPGVLIAAHTDTIFSADTDLTIRRDGDLIFGPGLGDNSIGAAALLSAVEGLHHAGVPSSRDLWFVATSREEGLGDLGGMRAAFTRLADNIDRVINVEGLAFGHIYHAGIAVRRLHITAQTAGGHSWLHFGRASATHAILQLGAQLTRLQAPSTPRTTYNIGMIEGGEAINAIATRAGLWLDLRSEERAGLEQIEAAVRHQIAAAATPDVQWVVNVVGDRPGGAIPPEHELVQTALAALAQVGIRGTLETGSTDANIPLALGCPAVTVGITRGGNAHRLDEYIETTHVGAGLRQLILLLLAAA